ncbi:methyltransferase domain-containing protein [Stenotrophomonas sp. 278]|uniref:class I SAM-dependent methyltransferase n=1 Tax=Stenotrophomonas sp. 278 TaxID=2479851 RepID=UPI000F686E8A|nr:methyltransferase domain-containing protein [Stenotrophomonas sp. 278]RRU15588.1 methyltransferase domain-containing protein [Stenotrophomonas sp. 278]
MNNNAERGENAITTLVAALPEKYQPIFGHPELSDGSSRSCVDRLQIITDVVHRLQSQLGRPVRVLDLGCAQGFFSLSLAADGCTVVGADYLQQNVEVCRALAAESGVGASFVHGSIEDLVCELKAGQYDVVLGLSVFHHLVHMHGLASVTDIIAHLAAVIPVGIYELALREEPVYWGPSQPERASDLLDSYAFVRFMGSQPTHLSGIDRPLYYASSRYWHLGRDFRLFDEYKEVSHAHAMGSHHGTRRYFFAKGLMLKRMSLEHPDLLLPNVQEYEREVAYLGGSEVLPGSPRLLEHSRDKEALWLLRELLPGQLLSVMMARQTPYSNERVVDSLLDQLVALERSGRYHNDIRPWNVIVDDAGDASFIDYGAISDQSEDCVWPDHLLLAFLITVREIVMGQVREPYPTRRPLLDVNMLPMRYRSAFLTVLSKPEDQWTFAALKAAVDQPAVAASHSWTVVTALNERALLKYEDALEAKQGRLTQVERELQESLDNAHRWFLKATEREQQVAQLSNENQAQTHGTQRLAGRLERLGSSYSHMREELEAVRRELSGAHQNAHQWFLRATQLEGELHALHRSRSWRWTRPLRFFSHLVQRPRYATRRVLLALMRRVMARPALARALNRVIMVFPGLHAKLRSVAVNHAVVDAAAPHVEVAGQVQSFAGTDNAEFMLSIRGRAIHQMLIAKERREGRQ